MKPSTVKLPETLTMSLQATSEPRSIETAFDKLHRRVKNDNRRKFFGVINPGSESNNYRACVATNDEFEIYKAGLEKYTIPGGNYVSATLKNWESNLKLIPELFERLSEKQLIDATRPFLEFYKSSKELVLYLPIIPREQQLTLF